ncbi:MAG TPA: hypothetical protein VK166_14320 [Chitinophagaceae bacterium]|nr:hypothetical protein [Chitinophagaceae bacterium]
MLAYNKDKLDAWMNRTMVEEAAALGLISETETASILVRYPSPFFSPKPIVRIGLGIATLIAVSTFFSFILLIAGFNMGEYGIQFLYGTAVFVVLEFMIRKKSHFRSGIDDLLLYQGFWFIIAGMYWLFERAPDPFLVITAITTVAAVAATIRYADRLMAGLALIAFIVFLGYLLKKIDIDLYIYLPQFTLVISIACWFAASKLVKKPNLRHYHHCFEFLMILSLVLAALSSNYYVFYEGWYSTFYGNKLSPFWRYFFAATTALVPLITIISGFLQKDKKRIRVGTFMVVGAVMTFHYYFTSTPTEILCIVYGALLLLISYWLLKHHKPKENGISFSERQDSAALYEIESMLIGAGVGMITPEQSGGRFGGGSFGGAGSGGNF